MNISSSDTLFATAISRGNEILNRSLTGIGNIADMISDLRNNPAVSGLVTIRLRNSTRGWTQQRTIYI